MVSQYENQEAISTIKSTEQTTKRRKERRKEGRKEGREGDIFSAIRRKIDTSLAALVVALCSKSS